MALNRSINYLCELVQQTGSSLGFDATPIENMLLKAFFSVPDRTINADCLTLAHDLKNRLSAIYMAPDVLRESVHGLIAAGNIPADIYKEMSPRAQQFMRERNTKALVQLTKFTTDLHAEAGALNAIVERAMSTELARAYAPNQVPIDDLLVDAKYYVAKQNARAEYLRVTYQNTGLEVVADLTAMNSVFLNLIKNATEAMGGRGTIAITVEPCTLDTMAGVQDNHVLDLIKRRAADSVANELGYRAVKVHNCGPKLDEKAIKSLFSPGYTTKRNGSGVGLITVASRMQDSRGFISYRNCDTGGVTFTVYLPTNHMTTFVDSLPLSPQ